MTTQVGISYSCDRCGAVETIQATSRNPHEEDEPPKGWGRLNARLLGRTPPDRILDLCSSCVLELEEWIEKAPEALTPNPARRFAFFFAGLPHEMKLQFVRTALKGEYRLEREAGDPVAAMAREGV